MGRVLAPVQLAARWLAGRVVDTEMPEQLGDVTVDRPDRRQRRSPSRRRRQQRDSARQVVDLEAQLSDALGSQRIGATHRPTPSARDTTSLRARAVASTASITNPNRAADPRQLTVAHSITARPGCSRRHWRPTQRTRRRGQLAGAAMVAAPRTVLLGGHYVRRRWYPPVAPSLYGPPADRVHRRARRRTGHPGWQRRAPRPARRLAERAAPRPPRRINKPVGPHTLRHAFITALDAGVPLRDVQEVASHADSRTTMRFDRARVSLDRHATYTPSTRTPPGSHSGSPVLYQAVVP